MNIVLDAMGSDKYPDPEVQGAIKAIKAINSNIILVGDESILSKKLSEHNYDKNRISIVHAPEVVDMWDKPVESAQKKPNNSMAVGIRLIKNGSGEAFVTAGNTGGAMFNALKELGRIRGVQRPALTATFPTRKGSCVVLDIGANADCRPDFLLQFAQLGSIYAENISGISKPRIGLISNGEEPGKGNQLVKDTYQLLASSDLNFIGNVEPKELFAGDTDIVICDGFTGNVLMKTSEAVAKMIIDTLRIELMGTFTSKLGALLAKPAFLKLKKMLDPNEIGAAPLLGIDGLVFVGHGRSDENAILSALVLAEKSVELGLMTKFKTALSSKIQ